MSLRRNSRQLWGDALNRRTVCATYLKLAHQGVSSIAPAITGGAPPLRWRLLRREPAVQMPKPLVHDLNDDGAKG